MPNIDVTKIAGYEEMSPEEKIKALEEFNFDDNAELVKKYKANIDRLTHEASVKTKEQREVNEKYNSTITEKDKELEEYKSKVDAIMKEKSIADNKAQFISLGYNETLAEESAKALVEGDTSKVFENQKLFKEELVKQLQAEALKNTPKPQGGNGESSNIITKDDFKKMSYEDMCKFSVEHPEEFKKFSQN